MLLFDVFLCFERAKIQIISIGFQKMLFLARKIRVRISYSNFSCAIVPFHFLPNAKIFTHRNVTGTPRAAAIR